MDKFIPDMYYKSIFDINYKKLKPFYSKKVYIQKGNIFIKGK